MVSSDHGPETSLEFCEVVGAINSDSILSPESKQQALMWLNDNFDAETNFTDTVGSIDNKVREAAFIRSSRDIGNGDIIRDISKMSSKNNVDIMELYRAHIMDLLKIKDIISDSTSYLKASICALLTQGKYSNHKDRIDRLNRIVDEWSRFLLNQRKILEKNLSYAKTVNWPSLTSNKSVINFWTQEHEILILAV